MPYTGMRKVSKQEGDAMWERLCPEDGLWQSTNSTETSVARSAAAGKSSSQRPLRVFLCHASNDKPVVRKLHQRLCAEGIDAWLDEEKLLPGQEWQCEISKAVRASDVVVVCLSRNSISKSGYVQKEINLALDVADEKPDGVIFLIPARLEECDIPERLGRWQWVNLFEGKGYERLLHSLRTYALQKDTMERFAHEAGTGVQLGIPGLDHAVREVSEHPGEPARKSSPRHLRISIERTGDWAVDATRLADLHRLLTGLSGPDRFSLRLTGGAEDPIEMDFPSHTTLISEELLIRLRALVGSQSVVVISVFDQN